MSPSQSCCSLCTAQLLLSCLLDLCVGLLLLQLQLQLSALVIPVALCHPLYPAGTTWVAAQLQRHVSKVIAGGWVGTCAQQGTYSLGPGWSHV